MSREELQQKSRFRHDRNIDDHCQSSCFLFYVGSSLVNTTKKYKETSH